MNDDGLNTDKRDTGASDVNPYADHSPDVEPGAKSNSGDQSVFAEPWMTKTSFEPDQYSDAQRPIPNTSDVEHTVWDEPGLSRQLAGKTPDDALTWARWFEEKSALTSVADSWLVTGLLCVLSGPLAVFTAGFRFGGSTFDIILLLLVIPAAEELLKVMLPLWVVEKRPYLFIAPFQLLLCCACSGLFFGALRHVFAVSLYNPGGTISSHSGESLLLSIAMHVITSSIAGMALVRIWSQSRRHQLRPSLTHGGTFGTLAIATNVAFSTALFALKL
ncbi:MAG: hypothetical protein AB8G99_13120 [Planctomycetaceae bacterium]